MLDILPAPLARQIDRIAHGAVRRLNVPAARTGYRWLSWTSLREAAVRRNGTSANFGYEMVEPAHVRRMPLPRNVASRDELPREVRYWGLSMYDVPERRTREAFVATVPNCRVVTHTDRVRNNRYFGVLTENDRILNVPGSNFKGTHAAVLRSNPPTQRIERATWILEPSYLNFSIWLRTHLPKLILLRERGDLERIMLPGRASVQPGVNSTVPGQDMLASVVEHTAARLGVPVDTVPRHDPEAVLHVDEMTVVGLDMFPTKLLTGVRDALVPDNVRPPFRHVLVSRARASRRQLANEEQLWPMLEAAGFERVVLEELSFSEQLRLLGETKVLLGAHGAGLTNIMFCPPGAHLVEIMDPGYPCPNFYAMAAYMGHDYWLLRGEPGDDREPGLRSVIASRDELAAVLDRLSES